MESINKLSAQVSRLATGSFWAIALGVCFSLPGFASGRDLQAPSATAETDDLNSNHAGSVFGPASQYDDGMQSSVAAHRSGFVLEFHKTEALNSKIWYHVGTLSGSNVTWGSSQYSGFFGYWPTVAISNEGYVLLVYSTNVSKDGSDLKYRVGKIDPNGGVNQSVRWLTDSIHWDGGFHSSIAINDHGVIVGVHETGHASTGLYYRVGHLRNPAAGDYTIQWDSGAYGIQYDDGINPHIAINQHNQVVEVHQVTGESVLHYRRGTVSGGRIHFGKSGRYDNNGKTPAIVLLDSGVILEMHTADGLVSRTGKLRGSDPEAIEWGAPFKIFTGSWHNYPALAIGGFSSVIATYDDTQHAVPVDGKLYCVVGEIQNYPNGTLLKGSDDKVYVVLNDYRFLVPDPVTFGAMGYNWDNVLSIDDNLLKSVLEGAPLPSVPLLIHPFRYPNGTVLKGSGDKVYVVLNNYRFWIPDHATFDAMGYKWENIMQYPDNVVNAIPEGTPFPSVTR